MIDVKTKVFQSPELQRLFAVAPNQYNRALKIWLTNEKVLFVGGRFRKGVVSRDLMRKKIFGTSESWNYRVSNFFRGFVDETGGGLKLVMGANLRGKGGIQESIAKMANGSYTQTSGSNVVIPIFQNGVEFKTPRKLILRDFKEMLKEHKLFIIQKAGRISYVDRETGMVKYVSVKRISVPQQYNFVDKWNGRIPAALVRGQKTIDRETERIAKGVSRV
ncbi:MAG: hypothetical protein PHN88_14845 [Ignavibacteria bacterium]|nr:hypothetical protein [Ignavibacteria bacterium]